MKVKVKNVKPTARYATKTLQSVTANDLGIRRKWHIAAHGGTWRDVVGRGGTRQASFFKAALKPTPCVASTPALSGAWCTILQMTTIESTTPLQTDVDALTGLLDLMANFSTNEQRARYLLSSNWLRDRGAAAAEHAGGVVARPAPRPRIL